MVEDCLKIVCWRDGVKQMHGRCLDVDTISIWMAILYRNSLAKSKEEEEEEGWY